MDAKLSEALREVSIDPAELRASGFSEKVLLVNIPGGERAIGIWERLRDAYGETKHWPILRGNVEDLDDEEDMEEADADAVLAHVSDKPLSVQLKEALIAEREAMIEFYKSRGEEIPPYLTGEAIFDEETGDEDEEDIEWPDEPMRTEFSLTIPFDVLSGEAVAECQLALVATEDPSTCPAHLNFGGFNSCPSPDIHVAAMRQWNKRFGAVPAVISRDVIEMYVERPPTTPEKAKSLAKEQFQYCDDIVTQGTESVEALAVGLWGSPSWYFWWD